MAEDADEAGVVRVCTDGVDDGEGHLALCDVLEEPLFLHVVCVCERDEVVVDLEGESEAVDKRHEVDVFVV